MSGRLLSIQQAAMIDDLQKSLRPKGPKVPALTGLTKSQLLKARSYILAKSKKAQLLGMYPEEHREKAKPFVEWAHKKLPNENWKLWAVRSHRKEPDKFTPKVREEIEHYAGSQHIPHVAKVRFEKEHDLETGLNQLKTAEQTYINSLKKEKNLIAPSKTTKKILDVGDNKAWFSLGVGSCSKEGKAMGHCGNVPSEKEGDNILSLRTVHKVGGKEYHEPHLTFIENQGVLGEMKGRGNEKPAKHHHEAIEKLLHHTGHIPVGGGYAEENNFHIDDLDDAAHKRLKASRPEVFLNSKRSPLDDSTISKIIGGKYHTYVRRSLAANPNLHPSHHGKLASDSDIFVRWSLAANPNLHPSHQGKLASDSDVFVRWNLAANPNLHPSHHGKLASDSDADVRGAMLNNPSYKGKK